MNPTIVVAALAAALIATAQLGCAPEDEPGCESDLECKGGRLCAEGLCMEPQDVLPEDGEGEGNAGEAGGGSTPEPDLPASCAATSTYCDGGVLFDCVTEETLRNCRSCHYTGSGTGHDYDTRCKAERGTSWPADEVFDGPGCYFAFDRICA